MSTHAYAGERQRQPVRRRSHKVGHQEANFWRAMPREGVRNIVMAARRFELAERKPGSRNGPLGAVALELLELMASLVCYKTGRLEPSIATMMGRLKRSRDAVVRALKNLKQHGFLDWFRRYEPTEGAGDRGPQVQQTSNAYRLELPAKAMQLVRRWLARPPKVPDDIAQERQERTQQRTTWEASLSLVERTALKFEPGSALAESMARMAKLMQERESAKQTECQANSLTRDNRTPLTGPLRVPAAVPRRADGASGS